MGECSTRRRTSSIYISNSRHPMTSSRMSKSIKTSMADSGRGSASKVDLYEQSLMMREEKENFIEKKFNKIRKDVMYGALPLDKNKIRSKDYVKLVAKLQLNLAS